LLYGVAVSESPEATPQTPQEPPEPKSKKPSGLWVWTRRLLKGVLGLVIFAILLVVGAYGALQTSGGRRLLLDELAPVISALIPGELRVGSITEASVGAITLRDIEVLDREGELVLRVRQARTRVRFSSLLEGRVELDTLVVHGARVVMKTSERGNLTIAEAFVDDEPSEDDGSVLVVVLHSAAIHGSTVVLNLLDQPPVVVRDLGLQGRVEVAEDVRITLDSASFRTERGEMSLVGAQTLSGAYDSAPGATSQLDTELRGEGDVIAIDASLRNPAERDGDMVTSAVDLEVSLAPLTTRMLAAFDQGELAAQLPPALRAEIHVTGTFADAQLESTFHFADESLTLAAHYLAEGESSARVCTEGLRLLALHGSLPESRLKGCFTVKAGVYAEAETPLSLRVEGAALDTTAIPDLLLSGRLNVRDSLFDVDALTLLDLPEATPPKLALHGRVGFGGAVALDLEVNDLRAADEPALAELIGPVRGALTARVGLQLAEPASPGAPGALSATVQASMDGLRVSGVRARRVQVDGTVSGTTADPRMNVRVAATDFVETGSGLRSSRTTVHAAGSLSDVTLDLESQLPGTRTLQVHARATERDGTWRAGVTGAAGAPQHPWNLQVNHLAYVMESGDLRVGHAVVSHRRSLLELEGGMRGTGRLGAELRFENFAVHDLLAALAIAVPGFEATLGGTATAGGTTRMPTLQANLALSDVRYEELRDLSAEVALTYGTTDARVDATIELADAGTATIAGGAEWGRPLPITTVFDQAALDLTASFDEVDLTLADRVVAEPMGIAGKLSGNVHVVGVMASPEFTSQLAIDGLVVPGLPVPPPNLEARIEASWHEMLEANLLTTDDDGSLVKASVTMEAPSSMLLGGLLVMSEIPFEVNAWLAERPLADLPFDVGELRDHGLRARATATVRHVPGRPFEGDWEAHLLAPERTVEPTEEAGVGEVSEPVVAGTTVPTACGTDAVDVAVTGNLRNERVTTELTLNTGGQQPLQIEVTAATPIDDWLSGAQEPTVSAALEGRITELDLGSMPIVCQHARGIMNGTLTAERLGTPTAEVALNMEAPALLFARDAAVALDLDAAVDNDGATANIVLRARDGGRGDIHVRLPFTWGEDGLAPAMPNGPLNVRARFTDLSLEPIAGITPFIRRRAGTIDGHLLVEGTLEEPVPSGEIRVHAATLMMPGLGQRLSDLEAHVSLTPTSIVVHELRARDVRGRVSVTGEGHFTGQVPTSLEATLEAHDFPVRQQGLIVASVTSRAELDLERQSDALRGELVFDRLVVTMPEELRFAVQELEQNNDIVYLDSYPAGWTPPEVIEPEEEVATSVVEDESPFVPTFFHIDLERPFWVQRTDFSIQLSASLDLGVLESGVRLSGEVRTQRGYLELLGTSFDIEEGTVRFPGGTTISPVMDLSAVANDGLPNEVRVRIKGNLTALELTFFDAGGSEITAGLAVQCITTAQCTEVGDFSSGGEAQQATDQAQSALASMTVGLLTAAARHGLGDAVPRIGVSTGGGFDSVSARVGFEANRLIPKFLRDIVLGLYIEGFVSSAGSNENRAAVQETNAQASGGFLIELRHPRSLVTRGRFAPRNGWSLDVVWQR